MIDEYFQIFHTYSRYDNRIKNFYGFTMFHELMVVKRSEHRMHHNRTENYVYIHFDVNQRRTDADGFSYCFRRPLFRKAIVVVAI